MPDTQMIRARIGKDTRVLIEVTPLGGTNQNIAAPSVPDLDYIWDVVSQIASGIGERLKQAGPKKAAVEFGVEIGAESGQLTALLVKGTGKANLKITLEWS